MQRKFVIAAVLHSFIYRCFLFAFYEQKYSSFIYLRKFVAGFLYDLVLLASILALGWTMTFFIKRKRIFLFYYLATLVMWIILNSVNFYMSTYFPDGLATWGMLAEYAREAALLAGTGVGMVSPLPLFIMFLPLLVYFIPFNQREERSMKRRLVYLMITIGVLVLSNAVAKKVRVNKHHLLGDNTVLRMISNDDVGSSLKTVMTLKSKVLSDDDISMIQTNPYASYLDKNHPLLKKDHLPALKVFDGAKPNLVFVILESVSAYETLIGEINDDFSLGKHSAEYTPFLNSLMRQGMVFTNFFGHSDYTAGGQVATLCSVYDNLRADDGGSSIMRNFYGMKLKCLPEYLKEAGYSNIFFNGYTKEFDNKVNFFPLHGIDELYCRDEITPYMNVTPKRSWGHNDDIVLSTLIKKADEVKGPFSAVFMSVNTHPPFLIGKEEPLIAGASDYLNSLRWTDRHLEGFFSEAKKHSWYKNTLFVFLADNGALVRHPKNSSDVVNHLISSKIPFFFYHPNSHFFKGIKSTFAQQVDIAPTILHLLGINTINHFVGESLFAPNRKNYVYLYRWFNRHYFYDGKSAVNGVSGETAYSKNGAAADKRLGPLREIFAALIMQNRFFNN